MPITCLGAATTQNFDTLAISGTANSSLPTGWYLTETGGGARDNELYAADNGGSNTGDTYSYGSTSVAERAFGGLQSGTLIPTIGSCFTNNTGGTITSLDIAYTGEEWRLGTAGRTDRMDFQYSLDATSLTTGAWTDEDALDFTTPNTATTGAKDGNAAGNRTALSSTLSSLNIANGATFWIRWTDVNASGADDGLSVDEFSLTANGTGGAIALTVSDRTVVEGNTGPTAASFTVALCVPAGPGGVTFDIATQDDTATVGDSDYQTLSLTGQQIAEGAQSANFDVQVNGDTKFEAAETFFVNVTNVTGATVADGQGLGTITNDDAAEIFDIQGNGLASPYAGQQMATVDNIVTALDTTGFFIQTPDARADADPETSNGIFVFTGSAPAVAVGDQVDVTGTVQEFFDFTELSGSLTINVDSSGSPLPTVSELNAAVPSPNQPQPATEMERFEGMLVNVQVGVVTGPSDQFGDVRMVAKAERTFREPGILYPGLPNLPVWDGNPEVFDIDPDGLTLPSADVFAGTSVVATGPLGFAFSDYSLLPTSVAFSNVPSLPAPVRARAAGELVVGSQNVLRLFDTVDDPDTSDDVPTQQEYDDKVSKLSLQIRTVLGAPDIVALEEVENITALTGLADKIQADDPTIVYTPRLMEGNDIGGIDIGYLIRDTVQEDSLTQFGKDDTYTNPQNGEQEILNDRPPLVLDATYTGNGAPFPLTVIAVHQRSLGGIDGAEGPRVREKRHQQALRLSQYIQTLQEADSTKRIVVVGDFNAYEFSDGYVDVLGQVTGNPDPAGALVPATDEVDPDLTNQVLSLPAAQRYSFVFDGSAQVLDHALTSAAADPWVRGMEYSRGNSDAPDSFETVPNDAIRSSDHDGVALYLMTDFDADGFADDQDNCPGISNPGQEDANNDGVGDACAPTAIADAYEAAPEVGLRVPAPGVLGNDVDPDGEPMTARLVSVSRGSVNLQPDGSFVYFTYTDGVASFVYEITDSQGAKAEATVSINVTTRSDLQMSLFASPNPQTLGGQISYFWRVRNNGPSATPGIVMNESLPSGTTFLSASASRGTCSRSGGSVSCAIPRMLSGAAVTGQIVVVARTPGFASSTATVSGTEFDPNMANNAAQVQTVVGGFSASPAPLALQRNYGGGSGDAALTLDNVSPLSVGFMVEEANQDLPWLSVAPASGTIGPESSGNVTATFSTAGQNPGLKRGQLRIVEDSPFVVADVPVCFTVRFLDVPTTSPGDELIHALAGAGVTSGCGPGVFCPAQSLSRGTMAVWLLRGREGAGYTPPAATGNVFADVPSGSFAADFIEELFNRGITSGCGSSNYCASAQVTRGQIAVFLLKTLEGSGYVPPPAQGVFADVAASNPLAPWIEELVRRGFAAGCGGNDFCPNQPATREQTAIFTAKAFSLPRCAP